MQNLKIKPLVTLLIILNSCSTASYFKIYTQEKERAEIIVTSDRIVSECIDLEDPPEARTKNGKFLLHLFVLDNSNRVIRIARDNIHERINCYTLKSKVDKIIEQSDKIYIGGMINLEEPKKIEDAKHLFTKHGKHQEFSPSIGLILLKGSNGKCFTMFDGDDCDWNGFPIRKLPF